MPAAMARMARAMVTVDESLTWSKGRSPVRINQIASRIIPRFLPAKLFVTAITSPSELSRDSRYESEWLVILA